MNTHEISMILSDIEPGQIFFMGFSIYQKMRGYKNGKQLIKMIATCDNRGDMLRIYNSKNKTAVVGGTLVVTPIRMPK